MDGPLDEQGRASYLALLDRLYAARRFGVRLELERMERCLIALGSPLRGNALVVQVGGTNGKGSTSAFVESVLRAAGLRTGLYSSPHLSRFTERFRVAGAEVAPSVLVDADARVTAVADQVGVDLTFFERATAMAAVAFADAAVDVAVLEVGLGGRLDATTAVGADVAAVTGVALDHQEYLGDTIEAIAHEKAGIFRSGQRAVIGVAGEPEAIPILAAEARTRGVAALTIVDAGAVRALAAPLGLAGAHQRQNAVCALAVIDAAGAALGRTIDVVSREGGLARCRLPARLERVADDPPIIVDGAHNPHAARVVADALDEVAPGAAPWVLVLGVSSDKDAAGIAAPLVARAGHVVITAARHERALPAAELAAVVGAAADTRSTVEVIGATGAALARARELAGPRGAVLVAGSLFLAGEAREILCGELADPRPVSDPLR